MQLRKLGQSRRNLGEIISIKVNGVNWRPGVNLVHNLSHRRVSQIVVAAINGDCGILTVGEAARTGTDIHCSWAETTDR